MPRADGEQPADGEQATPAEGVMTPNCSAVAAPISSIDSDSTRPAGTGVAGGASPP